MYIHEHAEANPHKNNGMVAILAGHANRMITGTHTKTTCTIGELYLGIANDVLGAAIDEFPTAGHKMTGIV